MKEIKKEKKKKKREEKKAREDKAKEKEMESELQTYIQEIKRKNQIELEEKLSTYNRVKNNYDREIETKLNKNRSRTLQINEQFQALNEEQNQNKSEDINSEMEWIQNITGIVPNMNHQKGYDRVITVNVGGILFETTLYTLTQKFPGSRLAQMFLSLDSMLVDENGNYFIDRDGNYFSYILLFIRNGSVVFNDEEVKHQVLMEAGYYEINIEENVDKVEEPNEETCEDIDFGFSFFDDD